MTRWLCRLLTALLIVISLPQIGGTDGGPNHRIKQTPPIQLGTSGGNVKDRTSQFCCSGTLGALVRHIPSGVLAILSNNHVLAVVNKGLAGDDINQPGLIDASPGCQASATSLVADLSLFKPISFTSDNTMDAAGARIRPGMVRTDGAILDIGSPSSTIRGASVGLGVKKSGRTTGLTQSSVGAINVTINVRYPTQCGSSQTQVARFVQQIRITGGSFSAGGDSGSLIVENTASCPRPVGLLFAGSPTDTFANLISNVLAAGNAQIVGCGSSALDEEAPTEGTQVSDAEVAAAIEVQERHTDALMQMAGVLGTGIGRSEQTGQAVLEVYLEEATAALDQAIPQELDGMPVQPVVTGVIYALSCQEPSASPRPTAAGGLAVMAQDVAAAVAAQERYTNALMQIKGVVGTGVGQSKQTGHAVVEVYLERATPELDQTIPQELDGVPVKKVVVGAIQAQ